jgi:hypothetical protein
LPKPEKNKLLLSSNSGYNFKQRLRCPCSNNREMFLQIQKMENTLKRLFVKFDSIHTKFDF